MQQPICRTQEIHWAPIFNNFVGTLDTRKETQNYLGPDNFSLCPQESESEEEEDEGKEKETAKSGPKHIDTEKEMLSLAAEAEQQGTHKGKGKKRGAEEVMERIAEKKKRAKEQAEAQKQWFDLKVNTSVYVTGLPDDIDEPQLAEV